MQLTSSLRSVPSLGHVSQYSLCRYYIQAEKDWWSFADGTETGLYTSMHLPPGSNTVNPVATLPDTEFHIRHGIT
jgi:hypothetical protein